MDFIKDNVILIVPNNYKEPLIKLISSLDKPYNIKIYTLNEVKKKVLFDYDEKTINYLMKKYKYNYSHSKDIIESIYYTFFDDNFEDLNKIKEELILNNLLYFDNFFVDSLKDKEVIAYGFKHLYKFDLLILDKINASIKEDIINDYSHEVNIFNSINEEIEFIVNDIINKINNGVNINNIYISNISDDYMSTIKRIFSFYNIPINLNEKKSLLEIESSSKVLNNLKKVDKYLNEISSNEVLNKCINVLNKYYWTDLVDVYDLIKHDFKNTFINKTKYKDAVNVIDLKNDFYNDDDHIYLIGFAREYIPKFYKDEDYISDSNKPQFLETTNVKNNIELNIWEDILKNTKNLTITFSKFNLNVELKVSSLIDKYKEHKYTYSQFSNLSNQFNLAILKDDFYKYGNINNNLSILNYNYPKTIIYDNSYKKINIKDKALRLSYSKLNTYYLCGFRFYLEHILKLDPFNETFSSYLGTLTHEILSKQDEDNFNIEDIKNNFLKNNPFDLTKGNLLFINKVCKDLEEIISIIKDKEKDSLYQDKIYEKHITFEEEINGINVTFNGFIDKIMKYKESAVIIDYKSFDPDIDISTLNHGLNMQLPMYLYLMKKTNPNLNITGIYYQNVNRIIPSFDYKKDIREIKEDNLKLKGYTIDDLNIIKDFDVTFDNSKLIHGMRLTKNNNFYAYTKVLSEKKFDKMFEITKENIEKATKNMMDGAFDINPKIVAKKNVSCEFCNFKSICFVNDKDYVYLNQDKDLTFLRGDDNEMD